MLLSQNPPVGFEGTRIYKSGGQTAFGSLHTILIIVTSSNLQSAIHTPTYTICTSFEYIRFKSVILLIPKYAVHLVIYLVTFICFVQFEVISAPYINILLTAPNYYSKLLQYADLHFCLCLLPHGKRKMFLHRFFLTGRVWHNPNSKSVWILKVCILHLQSQEARALKLLHRTAYSNRINILNKWHHTHLSFFIARTLSLVHACREWRG